MFPMAIFSMYVAKISRRCVDESHGQDARGGQLARDARYVLERPGVRAQLLGGVGLRQEIHLPAGEALELLDRLDHRLRPEDAEDIADVREAAQIADVGG